MSELTNKSLKTLEFPKVLTILADFALSEEAKEQCLSLKPTDHLAEAEEWQAQCSAARRMMEQRGAPPLSGIRPVKSALTRAKLGGALNNRELLDIASVLRTARATKSYHSAEGQATRLDSYFRMLNGNKYLEERISSAIISEEEMSDGASPELSNIRRHMRITATKARDLLGKYISSGTYAKVLQEPLITQRSGRFVIPVKAEHKGTIPGLVHDVSASGATLYIEPMPVVQAGNELRELEGKEKKEIERILAELSAECDAHNENIAVDYEILVTLDVVFAKAKLSSDMNAHPPKLNNTGKIQFRRARHPLLDRTTAVPIDVWLGGQFRTLIITGPNTGGKTVTLKTLGLLTLMASCGLHLPVSPDSEAFVTSKVYADIGDEQSIAQSLSTFSSHMTNIVGILAETQPGALALFDELGAGTDPVEGAALAVAIIEEAGRNGAFIAATTHYAELKSYAITTPGVENASCEFSVETLRPTYRLLIGIPGKSNAFAISGRLGLPPHVIEAAAAQIGTLNTAFEDVLTKLEQERQALEAQRSETETLRRQAEEDRVKSAEYRALLEKERDKAAEKARGEARLIVAEARRNADEILRELNAMKQSGITNEQMTALRQKLNEAENAAAQMSENLPPPEEERITAPLKAGDEVILSATGIPATVLEPPDKSGNVSLQAGILKVTAHISDLRPPKKDKPKKNKTGGSVTVSKSPEPPKLELDLRGQMTEEGVMMMEQFIDSAVMRKMETVTVIHGKGTGALRAAVHAALRKNKCVRSFRLGTFGEGESGVTIITLK